jgi:hypothetical protein
MRTIILLDNVDASTQQISIAQNFEKRTDWKLFVDATGLDGTPELYIEEIAEGGKCSPAPTTGYTLVCNSIDELDYFPITEDLTIEKKDFKSNWFRVRIEPNDNTTGTITVKLAYKSYP